MTQTVTWHGSAPCSDACASCASCHAYACRCGVKYAHGGCGFCFDLEPSWQVPMVLWLHLAAHLLLEKRALRQLHHGLTCEAEQMAQWYHPPNGMCARSCCCRGAAPMILGVSDGLGHAGMAAAGGAWVAETCQEGFAQRLEHKSGCGLCQQCLQSTRLSSALRTMALGQCGHAALQNARRSVRLRSGSLGHRVSVAEPLSLPAVRADDRLLPCAGSGQTGHVHK